MEEITYLNGPTTTVTSSRVVIGAQTFATRNIGSVSIRAVPKPRWPLWVGLLGGLLLLGNISSGVTVLTIISIVMIAAAAITAFSPGKSQLRLLAGAGEVVALESTDTAAITKLHNAIVEAIAAR